MFIQLFERLQTRDYQTSQCVIGVPNLIYWKVIFITPIMGNFFIRNIKARKAEKASKAVNDGADTD